jgi:hypothetical protein
VFVFVFVRIRISDVNMVQMIVGRHQCSEQDHHNQQ